jgi:hypothetical protein
LERRRPALAFQSAEPLAHLGAGAQRLEILRPKLDHPVPRLAAKLPPRRNN